MKKILLLLLFFVFSLSLVACGSTDEVEDDFDFPSYGDDFGDFNPDSPTNGEESNTPVITDPGFVNHTDAEAYDLPYQQKMSDGGKMRIVNRQQLPHVILSALLRTDLLINADFLDESEIEDYFAICKETGFNTIELSIMWSQVEPEKDQYDFSGIKHYLDFAKKYGLKINIEWYGSLVDGESHGANIPKYITSNPTTYPVIADLFDFANYGRCRIMEWDNPNLLERERMALYKLMNYIYEWNHDNNMYDPVIMVQLGQGADRFQRWRIDAYDVKDLNGNDFSAKEAWSMINTYINEMGRAVKYSKYKALTRSEFCEQNAVVGYVENVAKLEFVDIVSPTYLHDLAKTKSGIKSFAETFSLMTIMNVENWANDNNHKQTLATMAMGGSGYVSYQLSCPNYFPESPQGALYGRYNPEGATLAEKFIERNRRATDTKLINNALTKAYVAVANAKSENFVALGMDSRLKDNQEQKFYMQNGLMFKFSNPKDSLGYVIYDGTTLYVYCTKASTLEINNCFIPIAQSGYFGADGMWVGGNMFALTNNNLLQMEANVLYRVRITNIGELPSKDELRSQGYATVQECIRG